MFCRGGVLVRLACFFLAELLSLYLIHGPPLIHIETEATIRFLCSLFFFCIPFLVWAEFVSNRENGFIKFTALAQCSLVAIVFFKYLVGPSLIGILSYRAQNLFLTIFAVFLSFIVAQLWVAGKGRTREASLGARFWLQHSSIPLVVICSVITTVVHRSYPVIPRWNMEWVMGTPRIQEEGLNLDLEVFSEGIEIRDPMMFFDAPDETASFCILTRRGLILGLWDNGGEVVSRELLDLRDTIGELEMELGALSAAFGLLRRRTLPWAFQWPVILQMQNGKLRFPIKRLLGQSAMVWRSMGIY